VSEDLTIYHVKLVGSLSFSCSFTYLLRSSISIFGSPPLTRLLSPPIMFLNRANMFVWRILFRTIRPLYRVFQKKFGLPPLPAVASASSSAAWSSTSTMLFATSTMLHLASQGEATAIMEGFDAPALLRAAGVSQPWRYRLCCVLAVGEPAADRDTIDDAGISHGPRGVGSKETKRFPLEYLRMELE